MPPLADLLKDWWKQILGVVIVSTFAVGVIVYLQPKQYCSTATAVAASAYNSDKSRIFSENIQSLYSTLGTPDDLDMVVGTAELDTVYLTVTDQFNLFDHYKLKGDSVTTRQRAAKLLQKNSRVYKSDFGELKVKVWDTDPRLAAELSNALMNTLQLIQTNIKNAGNEATLASLREMQQKNREIGDSNHTATPSPYDQLIAQYSLMVQVRPAALVIIENARPSMVPDRPNRLQTMLAAAVLSFFFGIVAALFLSRKKLASS